MLSDEKKYHIFMIFLINFNFIDFLIGQLRALKWIQENCTINKIHRMHNKHLHMRKRKEMDIFLSYILEKLIECSLAWGLCSNFVSRKVKFVIHYLKWWGRGIDLWLLHNFQLSMSTLKICKLVWYHFMQFIFEKSIKTPVGSCSKIQCTDTKQLAIFPRSGNIWDYFLTIWPFYLNM